MRLLSPAFGLVGVLALAAACATPDDASATESAQTNALTPGGCSPGHAYCGGDKLEGDADVLYQCDAPGPPIVIRRCAAGCVVNPSHEDACVAEGDTSEIDWRVNGFELLDAEKAAVRVIANEVVSRLTGSRDEQLTVAARATWWALKEGTWSADLSKVYGFSLCNSASGDHLIGPTDVCGSGRAWQVGIAAVQVPGHSVADLEALASKLYPGRTAGDLLLEIAHDAGLASSDANAVASATGSLRASWLLKIPAVGVAVVASSEVVPECIEGSKGWCYGTSWQETKRYAPTKDAALGSMRDLRRILSALAP